VSRQAVKKHLDVLSRAGLVRGSRRGREHIWQLEPGRLADARLYLERISRQWDDALDRLKLFVEEQE
jgi:DNA-binding transcriptional ArsR family regulator